MNILDTFRKGMDRKLPEFLEDPSIDGIQLNIGAGKKLIPGTIAVDYPDWKAGQSLPFSDGSVSQIYAFHFFEHLTKEEIIATFAECSRVLMKHGLINIVVPHWSQEAAHQDLDHKSFWGESTLKNFFDNPYYTGSMEGARQIKNLRVHSVLLMGVVLRNLAVLYQLEKI